MESRPRVLSFSLAVSKSGPHSRLPYWHVCNCHLVTFESEPTAEQMELTLTCLGIHLRSTGCRAIHTGFFRLPPNSPLFHIDGSVRRQALDGLLSLLAKSALSQVTKGFVTREVTASFGKVARSPVTIVIRARQSEEDTTASTSISRQVWSALANAAPPLMSVQATDRVIIVLVYSSSSQHPWRDRQLRRMMPADRRIVVITSNPDRLTRRATEVHLRASDLAKASAQTQHIRGHLNNAEEFIQGTIMSKWQSDQYLKVPNALVIDTSRDWDSERIDAWEATINELLPIEVTVVVPLGGHDDFWR